MCFHFIFTNEYCVTCEYEKKDHRFLFSFANIAGVAGRMKNTCRVDESRGYKNILRDFKVFFIELSIMMHI